MPAGRLFTALVVLPPGVQKNWEGEVPPEVVTDTLPLLPPLQLTGFELAELISGVGSVMIVVLVLMQPFASVTVMV